MEAIQRLELEISEMRTTLYSKENQLYELKRQFNEEQKLQNLPQLSVEQTLDDGLNACYIPNNVDLLDNAVIGEGLPRWAIERYSRQILLPDIGVSGQEKICAGKVLIVGAGGLGCPSASLLAGAGVGEIGIIDYDTVDVTNLHRQLLYTEADQGFNKVDVAANVLRRINSHIIITPYNVQLDSNNALDIISKYNLVLDCTDNVPTRYLLNDACVLLKVPLISGSALKMEGQLTIYGYRSDNNPNEKDPSYIGPCYRCLFPTPPPPGAVPSCSAGGVAGPVPYSIAALQALEAIKYLINKTHIDLLVGRMLIFDGEDTTFRTVKLRNRSATCSICSEHPSITQLLDYETFCKTKAKEKKRLETQQKTQKRREEKEKRMSGQCYFGFRKTKISECKEKWIQDVPKNERKIGPSCTSLYCAKARSCKSISEERRQEIFDEFWSKMDWKSKKNYVRSLVNTIPPKRRRNSHKGEFSRKGDSRMYNFFNKNNEKIVVCRIMFLNTLGIKEPMVRCWLLNQEKPKTKKTAQKSENVAKYFDQLQKTPPKCQFCKQFSNKMYLNLEQHIKNLHQLFNNYCKEMKFRNLKPVSRKTFSKVFSEKNLAIFKPKNDSDVCDSFSEHNNIHSEPVLQIIQNEINYEYDNYNNTTICQL